MEIKRLNRGEAEKAMSEWIKCCPQLPSVDAEYSVIRNDLSALFQSVIVEAEKKGLKIRDYFTDVQFGIRLYTYLNAQHWFSIRLS